MQTVVWLQMVSYTRKLIWWTEFFFQSGQSSGIATCSYCHLISHAWHCSHHSDIFIQAPRHKARLISTLILIRVHHCLPSVRIFVEHILQATTRKALTTRILVHSWIQPLGTPPNYPRFPGFSPDFKSHIRSICMTLSIKPCYHSNTASEERTMRVVSVTILM